MTQEDKELLLKDLCARLPYEVKVNVIYSNEHASSLRQRVCVEGDNELNTDIIGLYQRNEIDIKPYLCPLSSMTEEERLAIGNEFAYGHPHKAMDILHQRHIDYRGLIEKGLALDATGLNIY